uniref:TSA: Wollemia nobilis Ref_Wollemi_Transcript_14258_2599 transcribed RNA sequence n=1 Tax=Wollemia nobilis TaxID=56998 RepID=A0A0C9RT09_9CONI
MASRTQVPDFFSPEWVSQILKACGAAHKGGLVKKEVSNVILIAFSGSVNGNAFSHEDTKYGVCEIKANNDYFGSMENGVEWKEPRKSALVHRGALHQFLRIWTSCNLQQEVEAALRLGKTVLFTGHSIGGAIATLATLAILEKQPKCTSVFGITFGFPLIGDEVLARAVRRQGWANQFYHVVSKSDIFARILFAPCISVSEPLQTLLPYWTSTMQQMDDCSTDIAMKEPLPANLDINKFFKTVLQHGSTVVSYTSATNMDPTNKVIAALKPALKLNPFRPFGIYVFYSEKGAVWVENYEAVLPILYYTLAAAAQDQDQGLKDSITEHTEYHRLFPAAIRNMVKLEELSNLALSQQAAASSSHNAIEIQLHALGLGIQNPQARLALRAAGEVEKQMNENVKALYDELGKFELPQGPPGRDGKPSDGGLMTELKIYRKHYLENGCGCYDGFKWQKLEKDFKANTKRLKLASIWDRVLEMVENHKLPDDFQCREEWIRAGTEYRLLVEPLDIANYYRLGKNEDSGAYLTSARPRRYTMLQKWLQDRQVKNSQGREVLYPEVTQDSCFWAYVEDMIWSMKSASNAHDVKAQCDDFQWRVRQMIDLNDLCREEVAKEGSSFVKWWNLLSAEERAVSPLSFVFSGAPQANTSGEASMPFL